MPGRERALPAGGAFPGEPTPTDSRNQRHHECHFDSVANLTGIDWLIYGGESGADFRPEDKQWARDVMAICCTTGTAFFHKQSAHRFTEYGIELDGQVVREYPTPRRFALPVVQTSQGSTGAV